MTNPTATTFKRGQGTPVWRQIEEILAQDILSGQLQGRLSNETSLSERFGVNRHTIRQAVKALAERGLLEVVHGKGTFVREEVIAYELGLRTRFAHSLAKARKVGRSQILADQIVAASTSVAEMLAISTGQNVLQIDSLDVVEDKVLGVCTQYFPLPRFADFALHYRELGKTHLALAACGVSEFQRQLSRVSAQLPDKHVARQLQQSSSSPILCVESVYQDAAGVAIEYGISLLSGSSVQVLIEP